MYPGSVKVERHQNTTEPIKRISTVMTQRAESETGKVKKNKTNAENNIKQQN